MPNSANFEQSRPAKGSSRVKREDPDDRIIDLTVSPAAPNHEFDPFDWSEEESGLEDIPEYNGNDVDNSDGVYQTRNGVEYFVCNSKYKAIVWVEGN